MMIGRRVLAKVKGYISRRPDLVRLLSYSGWTFSGNIPVLFLSFTRSTLVARALGVEGFGTFALVVASVETINQLIDFRVFETTVKYVSTDLAQNNSRQAAASFKLCLGIDAFAGWLAFLVVVISAPMLNILFVHADNGALLIRLYAFGLIFSTVDPTATALLRVAGRFKWLSMMRVISAGNFLAITAFLLWLDSSIFSVVAATVIVGAVQSTITLVVTWHEANRLLSREWIRVPILPTLQGRVREMLLFTLQSNFVGTLKMLATRADVLILGFLTSAEQVGAYRLAVMLSSLLAQITDPMYSAIYPDLSRLWAKQEIQRFRQLLKQSSIVAAVAILPISVFLILGAKPLIVTFYGVDFSAAAGPFSIIVTGITVATIFFWTRPAVLSIGLAQTQTKLALGTVLVQLMLIWMLAPLWGAIGGAVALSSAYILGTLPLTWIVWRHIKIALSERN